MMPPSIAAFICAVVFVLGLGAGSFARGVKADRDMAAVELRVARAAAVAASQAQDKEAENRAVENRRQVSIQEKLDAANLDSIAKRADAARADAARRELLNAYTAVASTLGRSAQDPQAPTSGSTAGGPGLVLADVFGWCGARLQSCAAALDESRTAGQLCQQTYDAVSGI